MKVKVNVPVGAMVEEPKLPSLAVTVCGALSLFTHETVLLTPITTVAGLREKNWASEALAPEPWRMSTVVVLGEEAPCCPALGLFPV